MRLNPNEIAALVRGLEPFVKEGPAKLYLHGSRVKDHLKGGDIDLLLLLPDKKVQAALSDKYKFLASLKKEIGDRRIDLTIGSLGKKSQETFIVEVLKKAVLLQDYSKAT